MVSLLLSLFEGLCSLTVDFALTGLARGGQQVQKARLTYTRAVETLVQLASLQVRFLLPLLCLPSPLLSFDEPNTRKLKDIDGVHDPR